MIIAIDGPSGSGKSTVAKALAHKAHLTYLDTGAMYRAITWRCLKHQVSFDDTRAIIVCAQAMKLVMKSDERGLRVEVDGEDVSHEIRSAQVDEHVSQVAAVPEVRLLMLEKQRAFGQESDVVAEGRDIGTAVFPHAQVKIFLTCDAAARAHRRAVQRAGGDLATATEAHVSPDEEAAILANLLKRDDIDSHRKTTPLKAAEDAHHIDSSHMSVDEIVAQIMRYMNESVSHDGSALNAKDQRCDKASFDTKPTDVSSSKDADSSACMPHATCQRNSFDSYYDAPMKEHPWYARLLFALVMVLCWIGTKILWPWKFYNMPSELLRSKKPHIIVMNHVSALEPLMCVMYFYFHGIRVRSMYKSEFNTHKLNAFALAVAGGIPVQRHTADITCIHRCENALKRGEWLLIYPEGTRIQDLSVKPKIYGGFALLAARAHVDVLPICVLGAYSIAHAPRLWKKVGRIYFKVGEILSLDQLKQQVEKPISKKQLMQLLETSAMDRVYTLREELMQRYPHKL